MKKSVILIIFLFSVSFVYATDCAVRENNCEYGEINVLDVSSAFNAHVSSNNVNYMQLCCPNSQIISSTISATCSQTNPLKLYLDNTHVEVPVATGYVSTGIYNYKLCVDSSLTCRVSDGFACSPEEFCLLKFKENAGMTNTNAHVADCLDTFYSKSICCSSSGGECIIPIEICLGTGASNCCQPPIVNDPHYCSYGQDDLQQQGEQGHCCPEGEFWNGIACESANPCNPIPCPYNIFTNQQSYFTSPINTCIRNAGEYYEACCPTTMYGGTFLYQQIEEI